VVYGVVVLVKSQVKIIFFFHTQNKVDNLERVAMLFDAFGLRLIHVYTLLWALSFQGWRVL
jgi:hypothetical protein